ncbi:penicillin-binding transpeptidase domain-containing protein [Actinoalloteichus spitiensis]|uniref:penicillin-binding transpeptidase domain-containing protein n=1 Tax=Actinoalloteichus spitiensis TaxID=252394 RepID=UPI001FDFAFFD|nr:penicillin-binding transpeptidase domain-containing protein [Actinoalloteichus spitiensis]
MVVVVSSRPGRRAGTVLLAGVLSLTLSGCGVFDSGPGPERALVDFVAALGAREPERAAALTDSPDAALPTLESVDRALAPEGADAEVIEVRETDGSTHADLDITWRLAGDRTWNHHGTARLREIEGDWRIEWAPSVIHPDFGEQQTLAVRTEAAPLPPVLDRDGHVVLDPGVVISVLLDPAATEEQGGDVTDVATVLGDTLHHFDERITPDSVLEGVSATEDGSSYLVATLREPDYHSVRSDIYELPGVRFTNQPRLLPVTRDFGSQILPSLRHRVEEDNAERAGWRVVSLDATGAEVKTLHHEQPRPAEATRLTLSRAVQAAAEDAVEPFDEQAMLVAVEASTGHVLAVAQNAAADAEGPVALVGQYPPGSTFKIVTAAAALASGQVTVDQSVACPATTVIDSRLVPNNDRFDLGSVPFHTAFAQSCNTTFATLASGMAPDELSETARQFGLGREFVIPGLATWTGPVPVNDSSVERVEAGFGQGTVLASPFGMALVAATVAAGTTPTPVFLAQDDGEPSEAAGAAAGGTSAEPGEPSSPAPVEELPAEVVDALRSMMREVVTQGTATELVGLPEVHGKTGTAQFGDGSRSHGWFVGYQGDLAFAALVVDGGSSTPATKLAGEFLHSVG